MRHSPDAVTVVYEDQRLGYRQLNEQANQLARYLTEQEVRPGQLVPILVSRSLQMIRERSVWWRTSPLPRGYRE
jgi:non-ribosomal peptide synthetase component F